MYLSIVEITNPVVASNNRGEGSGNVIPLQKVTTPSHSYTVLSGYSIKAAGRVSMEARGANVWRKKVEPTPENPSGYVYGDNNSITMAKAKPPTPAGFDDAPNGWLLTEKGVPKEAQKKTSPFEVSIGISTTPFHHDKAFVQGRLPDKPAINPFSEERHFTRYMMYLTMNLDDDAFQKGNFPYYIEALRFLRVGGGHGSGATEISPAVLIWRFHRAPGRGGLYQIGPVFSPDEEIDLTPLTVAYKDRDITDYKVAGRYKNRPEDTMSVGDALVSMTKEGVEYIEKRGS